jgi:hypothetical protein
VKLGNVVDERLDVQRLPVPREFLKDELHITGVILVVSWVIAYHLLSPWWITQCLLVCAPFFGSWCGKHMKENFNWVLWFITLYIGIALTVAFRL